MRYSGRSQTALSDRPVLNTDDDALRNNRYAAALSGFIEDSDTPLTVGIQGGWGTGKTSLLNLLASGFSKNQRCLIIPVNAWEHSLFNANTNADVAISLLRGLVSAIQKGIGSNSNIPEDIKRRSSGKGSKLHELAKTVGVAALGVAVFAGKSALATAHIHTPHEESHESAADNAWSYADQIQALRLEIGKVVGEVVESPATKVDRFVFFIDDLDRIQPTIAIEILDILKNVFDVEHCIFVLAIDYEVVVKGLIGRYGARTKETEREFRQYFDKIIQVPFSMPVTAYRKSFNGYMQRLLDKLSIGGLELDKSDVDEMSNVAWLTTSGIPRSVKRIVNTMSLLALINEGSSIDADTLEVTTSHRIPSLFKLVCLQIGFPEIFARVTERPNVRDWSVESLLKPWELNTEAYVRDRFISDGYTEDWQHVVILLMRDDPWLAARSKDAVDILSSFLSGLGATSEDPEGNAELGMLLDSVAITSVGPAPTSTQSAGVRNDQITVFCRRLHQELIDAELVPSADVEQIYAKQTGGRNYVLPLSEPLGSGKITISKDQGIYSLVCGVCIPVRSTRKNSKLRIHMEEISRGKTITEIEYPYFLRDVGAIQLDGKLDELVDAFRQLSLRVSNQLGKFE